MPLPTITCPNCRATANLDVFLADDSVRDALDAVINAHPAGDMLIKPMLRYIGLFAPAKSKMAYSRMAALIAEIAPAMRAGQIERGGRVWPAPMEYWRQGFEAVLSQAHAGGLVLPLKSHGYLLEILARLSSKDEGKKERGLEQQRAGHAGVGTAPARSQQAVIHKEPRPHMPAAVRETLRAITRTNKEQSS